MGALLGPLQGFLEKARTCILKYAERESGVSSDQAKEVPCYAISSLEAM